MSLRLPKELFKDDVLVVNAKIQSYFSACEYANVGCANSNQLAKHIFDQLSLIHKMLFRQHLRVDNPNISARLVDLESLFSFLEYLSKDLEDKSLPEKKLDDKKVRSAQVNFASVVPPESSASSGFQSDDNMYEITSRDVNPFGYDMSTVNALHKFCLCCSKDGHFVVQCHRYREMDDSQKLKIGRASCRERV